MSDKPYYLTTPIYYVNAAPHIGHTYTTIAADVIRRWKRQSGVEAYLTTGTDEHGQKIARAAAAQGKEPKEFTDVIAGEFKKVWDEFGLQYDFFQRTTDPEHARYVGELYFACKRNGFIYSGSYSGAYCFSDELYVADAKGGDPCPDCGRPLEFITEENQYFQLSAFTQKLIEFHEANPDWCRPEIRRNEVLAFLKQEGGLKDLSISRSTVKWGIPVPDSPGQVFYVWFDALMAYYTAAQEKKLWPADLHLIGKEILRFHAIYWPAFLMAAEWPLPKSVFAHGWLLFDNDKMSKSKGNIVRATPIQKVLGADALRYFLLREVPFGSDGNFSYDALVTRYNADLANGLGNLAARTLKLARDLGAEPGEFAHPAAAAAREAYEAFQFHRALASAWEIVTYLDGYLVEKAPWKQSREEAAATLRHALGGLQLVCELVEAAIPESVAKIRAQIEGAPLGPVFPRADAKEVIPKMQELEQEELARQKALLAPKEPEAAKTPEPVHISIDDFAKVDLRVGLVLSAEPIPKADKLLHLKVDLGEPSGPRTILAGIAQHYKPEQLVNRKVVVVANLAPRKMRGFESQGMIVAASLEDGAPVLAGFLEDVPVGARLK
jgi:methionyl-tRNA synthetase